MLVEIREDIVAEVNRLVKKFNLSYFDACLAYCEKNQLDEEYVGAIIANNPVLREKIAIEAEQLNFLEKQDRLPI